MRRLYCIDGPNANFSTERAYAPGDVATIAPHGSREGWQYEVTDEVHVADYGGWSHALEGTATLYEARYLGAVEVAA